jgi:Mrp family chromosome partitioning ATPase/capsular polysaccharide biosynthesis protein
MPEPPHRQSTPPWLRPPLEHGGLRSYVDVIRERLWIVVGTALLTLAVAAIYLITADKVYEAEAELIVSPVSADDPLLAGLPLIRESSDPAGAVGTVSEVVMSLDVAELVREELGIDRSARSLLGDVTAAPVATSSIVAVTAEGSSPGDAADLANAFAEATVADRTEALHVDLDERIAELEGQLDVGGTGVVPDETLESEIARLQYYRSGPDPTVRVETTAQPPQGAASPRPTLTLAAATLAGIVLGIGAAFAAQTLDPRLRREEQLHNRYSLPILTRVPRETSQRRGLPLSPASVSPVTREAYRTLRANVGAAGRGSTGSRSILVTGSAPGEGKTTTALNLAASFALAGNSVILIEADLRHPAIAETLGVEVGRGIVGTLLEDLALEDALTAPTVFGPNLRLLLAEYRGGWTSELFSLGASQQLVEEAKRLASYVIIDSPPLTAVVDTLPLAREADDVVVVARLGVTRLDRLQELAELLANNDIEPLGFALLGMTPPGAGSRYYAGTLEPLREGRVAGVRRVLGTAPEREQAERKR